MTEEQKGKIFDTMMINYFRNKKDVYYKHGWEKAVLAEYAEYLTSKTPDVYTIRAARLYHDLSKEEMARLQSSNLEYNLFYKYSYLLN